MTANISQKEPLLGRIKHFLLGMPRSVRDPKIFHKISLVAFLAWVGLGADGLSSSAYGPDEAFRALAGHTELAVVLALITALTVFIISYSYNGIIEHFPHGGGGYVVATKLLGSTFGVVSGCALLIDYILTVSVSIAAGAAQVFSFLPLAWQDARLPVAAAVIVALIILNLRGAKESIIVLAPIFILFLVTHAAAILGAFIFHWQDVPVMVVGVRDGFRNSAATVGIVGLLGILAGAYARGAGTYTGIEAVSNGVQLMRDPKVPTAKRTMLYMALSLALTAGGILLVYLLLGVTPQPGKTLNAVLFERLGFGSVFMVVALMAEAALLFVAAQTGFMGGPRVIANLANDSWLPHRFSALSERLTSYYGIILVGGASLLTLFYTRGHVDALVTMYSINVFITFSLAQAGMVRFWLQRRERQPRQAARSLTIHVAGLTLCVGILTLVVYEKFGQGAWLTLVVTGLLVALCFMIRRHYHAVAARIRQLNADKTVSLVSPVVRSAEIDSCSPTAVLLVGNFGGLGTHTLETIFEMFPGNFRQVVFASVAVIDSGTFKGANEIERLEKETQINLGRYVALVKKFGYPAEGHMAIGMDVVAEAEKLCAAIGEKFPKSVFFSGKLIFERERWYQRLLHNDMAYALQRRLAWSGFSMVILPIKVTAMGRW
ncbi:amino acid transporter [Candidatus Uhrbacteria bacterium RIFCSPHIGHO2_02_FULL_60_10]|uniref:Amino acid transporter n=1 Tax=Candidatus Uhrbacteria bacterium RIFCSPHIGHO2_02_FULL_60_10 TaxID=1802392 RepID=A0A1F7U4W1_9BACT|nr:MAG: amino acid transporter [Candidatus Uhrbacteria bacterium RIFCSPHIGHO2_02_FULL_60_10]